MRLRRTIVAVGLAAAAAFTIPGVASAQQDRDCPDFASQAEAQAAFDARPGDPEDLDRDNDGIACEQHFGERVRTARGSGGQQVGVRPRGGVSTGDASTVVDPTVDPTVDPGSATAPVAVTAPGGAAPAVITGPAR